MPGCRQNILLVGLIALLLALSACLKQHGSSEHSALGTETSFVFLGDMHFDHPNHHDMDWVARDFPNDIVQINDYCRITRDNTPVLMSAVASMNKR
ncbi:MAG: hypothetical protein LLF76_11680 [Planctomycetaceae bacterium]|nr:hypothetical protein [Planctomycetaceae bacterium]